MNDIIFKKVNKELLNKNKRYILAWSGGVDSSFLFYYLVINNFKNIICAFVNYHTRVQSNQEEIFTKNLALKNNYLWFKKDFYYGNEKNTNFQDWARQKRYQFFQELALIYHCDVLIAHHFDDLIETFFIQKKRNALVSFYGIKDKNFLVQKKQNQQTKFFYILRPLLKLTKKEIILFLDKNTLKYYQDSSNFSSSYVRNQIRLNLNLNLNQKEIIFKKIQKLNFKLKSEIQKSKNLFLSLYQNNKIINVNILINYPVNIIKRVLFLFFEKRNYLFLIINKKHAFLTEVCKQIKSQKKKLIIIITNDYYLLKNNNQLDIKTNIHKDNG